MRVGRDFRTGTGFDVSVAAASRFEPDNSFRLES